MPEHGDDIDYADRIAAYAEPHRQAWQHTLEDMQAMAEEREEAGWRTLVIAAGNTAPEPPGAGESDRYGLAHVIPGNKAEEFREAVDAGDFPAYNVYRTEVDGRLFLVTELLDPDTETVIYIAANFELRHAGDLAVHAKETGEMYTHVQKLDGTPLGSFRHDGYEKFFPEADQLAARFNRSKS